MPARLIAYTQSLRASRDRKSADGTRDDVADRLQTICNLLRAETGHDFSSYKEKTLVRRIQRRMHVAQTTDVSDYIAYLRRKPDEFQHLFHEMLINVTEFFRDPAAFDALAKQATPKLLAGKDATRTLRLWVPGCATGEEVYSIAMTLKEALPHDKPHPNIIIFATDIDDRAIEVARAGRYRAPLQGISQERRERWFTEDGDDFVVSRAIRELCVFSTHSLIKDPPFSKLDLISCRNVLIYLNSEAQQRLIGTFHYALKKGGLLLLGTSESVSRHARLFDVLDKKQRLYARREDGHAGIPVLSPTQRGGHLAALPERAALPPRLASGDAIERDARRVVEKYTPAYVVVDVHRDVVRFSGDTGRYLGPSSGTASLNLFTLLNKGLRNAARQAVNRAFTDGISVPAELPSAGRRGSRAAPLRIVAEPLPDDRDVQSGEPQFCVVAFIELESAAPSPTAATNGENDTRLRALERELETTRLQLLAAVDSAESAAEELKSSNEEYQSVNEELQSSNEELETSKEEMQSSNEELHTINAELIAKNETLSRLSSDLRNLLESTHIATLFLDEQLHVRSYTPAVTELFHLREGDRGRPITEIAPNIAYPDLQADVKNVLRNLGVVERMLKNEEQGQTFLLRMRPYRTVDNVIDGVVLTFVDVSDIRRSEKALRMSELRFRALVTTTSDVIYRMSADWSEMYNLKGGGFLADTPEPPRDWFEAYIPSGEQARVRAAIDAAIHAKGPFDLEHQVIRGDGTVGWIASHATPILDVDGRILDWFGAASDITARKRSDESEQLLMHELNHRVKNTLSTVQAIAQQTLRNATSLEAFRTTFMERLIALARTHNLLAQQGWNGANLREMVQAELQPYQANDKTRIEIQGEPVWLPSVAVLPLSMGLHELATNAVKYGALSVPNGKVSVQWETRADGHPPCLHLRWVESGGPQITTQPPYTGFGRRLITEGLTCELEGTVTLDFAVTGVVCEIEMPAPPRST